MEDSSGKKDQVFGIIVFLFFIALSYHHIALLNFHPNHYPSACFANGLQCMERVKLQMDFVFRASPAILYQFLTTPSCLVRWFCDEVDAGDDHFTFFWGESAETATIIDDIEAELLRLQWEEMEEEGEFLEFRISESPVTGETILELSDFCDADELDDQRKYWQKQISQLRVECGG